jgi:hypothetical protein
VNSAAAPSRFGIDERRHGEADLAHVAHLGEHRPVHGPVEIGVAEDPGGALPPGFMDTRRRFELADQLPPVGVDPVKASLPSRGSVIIAHHIEGASSC